MELPGALDGRAVLELLLRRERRPAGRGAVRADRHHVGRAVREVDARAGEHHLHHLLGELAGRVGHRLVRGGDAAGGGVVVGAEVGADAAALGGGRRAPAARRRRARSGSPAASRPSARGAARPGCSSGAVSSAASARTSAATCSGIVTLGSVTTKPGGSRRALAQQGGDEEVERAERALRELRRERLDADADEGRERALPSGRARPRAAADCAWPSSSASGRLP